MRASSSAVAEALISTNLNAALYKKEIGMIVLGMTVDVQLE